jgi:predicted enzyme related to lactoylglutathione lyase
MSSVVHFEFSVPNPEEAAAFYSAVFGWSITKLPDPTRYWQIRTAEAPAQRTIPGGIVQSKTGLPRVSVTIQVPSLSDACTRVIPGREPDHRTTNHSGLRGSCLVSRSAG